MYNYIQSSEHVVGMCSATAPQYSYGRVVYNGVNACRMHTMVTQYTPLIMNRLQGIALTTTSHFIN